MNQYENLVVENVQISSDIDSNMGITQYSGTAIVLACLSENRLALENYDNTGYRIHPGAVVACRLLEELIHLLHSKSICEIGCGVGVLGVYVLKRAQNIRSFLFTDGNPETLRICQQNVGRNYKGQLSDSIFFEQFVWGSQNNAVSALFQRLPVKHFDVVIGSELMYYNTDVYSLVGAVKSLLLDDEIGDSPTPGLFIHAHVFRKDGQENELIQSLALVMNWTSAEIPIETFISEQDLGHHPHWYNVRCLISAAPSVITGLLTSNPRWVVFKPIQNEESCG